MGLPWFLQNTNKGAKYYANKNKDKVTYLSASEYYSVVSDIAKSGLMDGKYYR